MRYLHLIKITHFLNIESIFIQTALIHTIIIRQISLEVVVWYDLISVEALNSRIKNSILTVSKNGATNGVPGSQLSV